MKSLIIYSSRSGNTKIIAEAMADELNSSSFNLEDSQPAADKINEAEIIFIGSGVFGGHLAKSITEFLRSDLMVQSSSNSKKKITFFITWFGRGKSDSTAIKNCKKDVTASHLEFLHDSFSCFGQGFKVVRKGHPDEDDIHKARIWARKINDNIV